MLGKIYFSFIVLLIIFTNRYQFVTAAYYGPLEYLSLLRDGILLVAGFSYFFKKRLFETRHWRYMWWFLVGHLVISFGKQLLPGSYYGDLSDGQIGANLLAFLISLLLFIPLYVAAFRLSNQVVIAKKNRK